MFILSNWLAALALAPVPVLALVRVLVLGLVSSTSTRTSASTSASNSTSASTSTTDWGCKAGSEKRLDALERLHFEHLSQTEQRGLLSCSFTELSRHFSIPKHTLAATIENTWSCSSTYRNVDANGIP